MKESVIVLQAMLMAIILLLQREMKAAYSMLNNPLKTLTKKEWLLWLVSLTVVILSNLATNDLDLLTLISALLGVTALIFAAKGNVWAQFLMIIFCILYGIISFRFHYWGEMITYLGMTLPMAAWSAIPVGDTRFQKKCIKKMKSIADSGKTILFVSHQMNTIRQLCDRVIVLKEGQVIYDGDVEGGIRIYNSEAYMEKLNHYNFSDLARLPGYNLDKAEILSLDVLHNESCIYAADEPIEFKLRIKTKVPNIGDMSFRILVWQADETPIEIAFTKTFANINEIGEYDVEVVINKHNLAPGLYKLTIILSGGTSNANSENLDYVYPAFVFEILHADGTARTWPRQWGWVQLRDVDVKLIEE